jgi:hypothetical protein
VGDETVQIASRFSNAVDLLASLDADARDGKLARKHGGRLALVVRDALDAVEAVYGAGTQGVRNWPEQAKVVLAQIADVRRALERSGLDAEVRRRARALAETIDPGSAGG